VLDYYCAKLPIVATPALKAAIKVKSTKVKSHGNNVHDVIVAHVISADAQTNKQTDVKNEKQS